MNKDFRPYLNISPQYTDALQKFLSDYLSESDESVLLGAVDCCENYFGRQFYRHFRCGIMVFTDQYYWFVYRDDLSSYATVYFRIGTPIHALYDRPYRRHRWVEASDIFGDRGQIPLFRAVERSYRDIYLMCKITKYVLPKTAVHLLELEMSVCRYPVKDELYLTFHEQDKDFIANILFASHHVHAGNSREQPLITEWPPADTDPDWLLDRIGYDYRFDS